MSLKSKIKIEKFLNNPHGEIIVDANELLEVYMDKMYSNHLEYERDTERKVRIETAERYEDKLQELETKFEHLRETIKNYKKIMKEKGVKYK